MKILNLVYSEKSDIQFKLFKFPDGQQDILILNEQHRSYEESMKKIIIYSRFNSFMHLELIVAAKKALERLNMRNVSLYIPYLLGARSDRKFQEGGTSYMVDVIAPIINSLNFTEVHVLDCHSDVGLAVINQSFNITNVELLQWSLRQIDNTYNAQNNVAIVCPDGGALKKIYESVSGAKLDCDIIISAKHRDIKSGRLNGFDVPLKEHQIDKTLVWVDDICDGGGTFIGEVEEAKRKGHTGKRYLVVTHGIFSAGFQKLSEVFDGIFCTNSYSDLPKWQQEKDGTIITVNNEKTPSFVKQLNVF